MKSLIKFVLLILAIPIATLGLVLYTTADAMCGNTIYAEKRSPDNRYKAVVFQRDCGASTDFSTQISIIKANAKLNNKSGNIFIARGHPESFSADITWLSNSELLIGTERNGAEFKAEQSWGMLNQVRVSYGAQMTVR